MNVAKIFDRKWTSAVVAGVALLAMASTASAFSPRVPQVAFSSPVLQGYLNSVDGGVNALTDQLDAQYFATSTSGNTDFTLMVKLTGFASQNTIGIYDYFDANVTPVLYPLFPAAAPAGSSVACTFRSSGALIVSLFDPNGVYQGQTSYTGVDRAHFCFYIQNNAGTYYQQDTRNGNKAQALTYQGTGANALDLWLALEDTPFNAMTSTFSGAVLELQSVVPTPVRTSTWGSLKAQYR